MDVSIQLVSPASGEKERIVTTLGNLNFIVSIQLVSPASGESIVGGMNVIKQIGFHSISFPSEWGVQVILVAL